jgi:di/tricarboxylate transporter
VAAAPQRTCLLSTVGLTLGPVPALALAEAPMPGLSREAHALAGILAVVVVYWVTEDLPLSVTAQLDVTLSVLLEVAGLAVWACLTYLLPRWFS